MKLAPDEEVIFRTHPHITGLVGPIFGLLVIAAATGVAVARIAREYLPVVFGVAAILALIFFLIPLIKWASKIVTLTTHRVIVTTGILRRGSRVAHLSGIAQTSLRRGIGQRLIGSGTLELWTVAGQCVAISSLPKARWIAEAIDELIADQPGDYGTEAYEYEEFE